MGIKIISIDTEHLEKDSSFKEAYAFYVRLNEIPDEIWGDLFKNNFIKSIYLQKRLVTIVENKLRIVTSNDDNNEKHINFVKQLVEQTNRNYEEHKQREENEKNLKQEALKKEKEKEEEIKNKLKQIKIEK